MDCDEFVELVTRFLDGALDADTERRFRDHLAVCEGCEIYLDQFRRTIDDVGALDPDQVSGQARATLLTAFRDWHDRD